MRSVPRQAFVIVPRCVNVGPTMNERCPTKTELLDQSAEGVCAPPTAHRRFTKQTRITITGPFTEPERIRQVFWAHGGLRSRTRHMVALRRNGSTDRMSLATLRIRL